MLKFVMFGSKEKARLRVLAADRVREALVAARDPALYGAGRFADTLDGRTEAAMLYLFALQHSIRQEPADLQQAIADAGFEAIEAGLREAGVGDLTIPKRLQALGRAHIARQRLWSELALGGDHQGLADSFATNLFPDDRPADPHFARELVDRVLAFGARND